MAATAILLFEYSKGLKLTSSPIPISSQSFRPTNSLLINIEIIPCVPSYYQFPHFPHLSDNSLSHILGLVKHVLLSRTLFCEKYIVPRTTAAGKYISLYRKIRDQGMYLHSSTAHQTARGASAASTSSTLTGNHNNNNNASGAVGVTMRFGADRKGAAGNSSSFNINSKLCSIRE